MELKSNGTWTTSSKGIGPTKYKQNGKQLLLMSEENGKENTDTFVIIKLTIDTMILAWPDMGLPILLIYKKLK